MYVSLHIWQIVALIVFMGLLMTLMLWAWGAAIIWHRRCLHLERQVKRMSGDR